MNALLPHVTGEYEVIFDLSPTIIRTAFGGDLPEDSAYKQHLTIEYASEIPRESEALLKIKKA